MSCINLAKSHMVTRFNQNSSIQHDEPVVESHEQILAAVDSLELLTAPSSRAGSRIDDKAARESSSVSVTSIESDNVPSYMKPRCQLYAKMSADEWNRLKLMSHEEINSCRRQSHVQFDGAPSRRCSRGSSILKRPSEEKHTIDDDEHNALHPIQQKCREALGKMRIESVLKMLCMNDTEADTR